jgi:hypothetical protein
VELSLVQLSKEECPGWVGRQCLVSVATQTGVVMGISFLTKRKREQHMLAKLSKKYDGEPSSSPAMCNATQGRAAGTDRVWETPNLTTAYLAVDGRTCNEGRVLIETRTMKQLVRRPQASAPVAAN